MRHFFFILTVLFSFSACIKPPKFPEISCNRSETKGIFVLNEGQWGQNNASLDFLTEMPFARYENIYNCLTNKDLGDVGNDVLIEKDTMYLLLNGSGIIYKLQLPNLSLLNKIELNKLENTDYTTPNQMVKPSNGKLYVSSMLQSCVYVIRPNDMTLETKIPVENYGYGIASDNQYLYVACGSYAPIFQNKNHKIAIINLDNQQVEKYISLPKDNPEKVLIKGDTLIVNSKGDGLLRDTMSAISFISLQNHQLLRTYYSSEIMYSPVLVENYLFALSDSGIVRINLKTGEFQDKFMSKKQLVQGQFDYLNALSYDEAKEELYVFNGKNGGNGEAIVLSPNMQIIRRFTTGEFPRKLAFYR